MVLPQMPPSSARVSGTQQISEPSATPTTTPKARSKTGSFGMVMFIHSRSPAICANSTHSQTPYGCPQLIDAIKAEWPRPPSGIVERDWTCVFPALGRRRGR